AAFRRPAPYVLDLGRALRSTRVPAQQVGVSAPRNAQLEVSFAMTPRLGPRSTAEDVLQGRRLSEKSVLVTGCSSGIGFETARAPSAHGARVLLACRTRESAEQTASRIRESCPDANLTPVAMDLASFASIRGAVQGL